MNNQSLIRNFAIIAHVDHGKSTLADRFLEITNTIPKEKLKEQFLDQNPISRERGITIKLAPVRMKYILNPALPAGRSELYILNLIDTPGHVDFSYEVSRTLAACEGAILLVDATQGIQAQTVAHYKEALKENLTLIPVVNKIDLPSAQTEVVAKQLENTLGFKKEEIIYISAKTGQNVNILLEEIIRRIPAPNGAKDKPLRALIFDAAYDEFRGVIAYARVIDGEIKKNQSIMFFQNRIQTQVAEIGYFSPNLEESKGLSVGEIGYVITGIKDIRQCRVGDTITQIQNSKFKIQNSEEEFEPLAGYIIPKPMVFFGVYPKDANDFVYLKESLAKLALNDTALTYTKDYSSYLGSGFRVGFLGLLHAEIIQQRIKQEFNLTILLTMPQVLYKKANGVMLEPYMNLIVYSPKEYVGDIMNVCQSRKGTLLELSYHDTYTTLTYELPYSMFIQGLSAQLKAVSNGFASIDYALSDYKKADLVHLEVKINNVAIDVLSELVYRDEANRIAREKALRLKSSLPKQQFRQIIQSLVDCVIVAREEIPPFRKDVLSRMSGGDRRRKDKLLDKQKKGKERLVSKAKISIPQETLLSMIKNN